MADSRKREKDRNTKYWISQDQKELFRWNKNDFIGRLDSSVSSDEKDIAIEGYNIVCADHPSNDKEGGLCIYYEESFAVQFININFLNRCVLCEVTFDNKKGYSTVLYRSPNQGSAEFDNFLSGFENMLNVISSFSPDFPIILGGFNARSKSWWQNYINTSEYTKIDALTSYHGLHQLISQPTHILANSFSCIDLIFTDQPNWNWLWNPPISSS